MVVVGEVIAKPKFRLKPSVKCVDKVDDDDCVVLEADPDAPVAIENDKREDDPDELLVVSEKGQVLLLFLLSPWLNSWMYFYTLDIFHLKKKIAALELRWLFLFLIA